MSQALTDYAVLTSRYDNYRRGAQLGEKVLTPQIAPRLRQLNFFTTSGRAIAQSLLYRGTLIGATQDALVVVTTRPGSAQPMLYFLDPTYLTPFSGVPLPGVSSPSIRFKAMAGVLSTPVIDAAAKRLYLVNFNDAGGLGWDLMKFDISDVGSPKLVTTPPGGKMRISGVCSSGEPFKVKYPTGQPPPNDFIGNQLQRPGLLLSNGFIYVAFGSGDNGEKQPYNGWVFAYNASSLVQATGSPYCTSRSVPNGSNALGRAGIFQFGAGLTADNNGNVYFATGNGLGGPSPTDDGDAYVKLLPATSWSTQIVAGKIPDPHPDFLGANDLDLSSTGVVLLNGPSLMGLGAGKEGMLTLFNTSTMSNPIRARGAWNKKTPMLGDSTRDDEVDCTLPYCLPGTGAPGSGIPGTGGTAGFNRQCCPGCITADACGSSEGNIVHGSLPHIHGAPCYHPESATLGRLFWWGEKDYPRAAFWDEQAGALTILPGDGSRVSNDASDQAPTNWDLRDTTPFVPTAFPGGAMPSGMGSISADMYKNAVFWVNVPKGKGTAGVDIGQGNGTHSWLKAFNASILPQRHLVQIDLGGQETHSYPTIANGSVYVSTSRGSSFVIAAYRADLIDLFWLPSSTTLQHLRYTVATRTFGSTESLPSTNVAASALQPLAAGDGNLEVLWRGNDNNLWHAWSEQDDGGAWHSPQMLTSAGNLASDPSPVAPSPESMEIFWKGSDSALWHRRYDASTETWQAAESRGNGPLGSAPHAIAPGNGVSSVFWSVGQDLYYIYTQNGSWPVGKENLTNLAVGAAGSVTTPPMPIVQAPSQNDVFWKGADGNLWHAWYDGNNWVGRPNAAQSLGRGPLGSGPHPVATGAGGEDVFWRGTDNNLWHTYYDPGTQRWLPVGQAENLTRLTAGQPGRVFSEPYPVSLGDGGVEVFWQDNTGATYHMGYVPGSPSWTPVEKVNGPAGTPVQPI